ncbi:MAG: T9SS type A sorting domain-containing protein, partial [Bacteroidia bacterium]|nr:T9SS type A sorting domain-containing protein [Bacteroidia bacterium]
AVKLSNQVELQVSLTFALSVYPNPANNELFFSWNTVPDENSKIQIMDIHGKLVAEFNCKQSITKIPVETFSTGVYFYQAVYNGQLFTGKWVKR